VTLAALALLAYTGVVVDAGVRAPSVSPLIGSLGAVGLLMLVFCLWRADEELLPWALLLAGLGYGLSLAVSNAGLAEGAPLIGVGLLLCGELATWSLDERWAVRAERRLIAARAAAVGALALGGVLVGGLVLALAAAPVGGGLDWTVVGAAAVVALLGLAARLSRS
jgi:hypothetical protein